MKLVALWDEQTILLWTTPMKTMLRSVLSCAALLVGTSAAVRAADSLSVKPSVVDFGARGHGESPTMLVEISNDSKKPMRITEMRPSCGCTKVFPKTLSKPIAPGKTASVRVTMSSFRVIGKLDKYIAISTDTGASLKLPVRMSVFEGYSMEPLSLRIRGEVAGKPMSASTLLSPRRTRRGAQANRVDLEIEGAYTGFGKNMKRSDLIRFKVAEQAGGAAKVTITALPTLPEGRFSGELRGTLEGKPFVLPFAGEMYRGLRPDSSYFNFNRVEAAKPESFELSNVIRSINGNPFNVTQVMIEWQSAPKGVRLEIEPKLRSEGQEYTLEARLVRIPGAPLAGRFSGKVIVETDHPERPEITFRVMGFFPKARK